MTQKIQNPAIQIPDTPQMTDRDYITDMLTTEKYLGVSYAVAEHEASHDSLYQIIHSVNNETSQMQRQLYDCMFKNGLYSVEAADAQQLQQSYQQHKGYESQFPYKTMN
ncbi:spore coat protein [Shouchella shacheensis]|uniref:spore coat protein n=1 Tax=Shouchella shacheensis TaxID=1649580 RepID=UPI00073FE803|nr:spore coat protein [Shouchella shacheensis]